jgi:hypothetical protein
MNSGSSNKPLIKESAELLSDHLSHQDLSGSIEFQFASFDWPTAIHP